MNNNFKNPYDKALFACYILRRLNAGSVKSFVDRLRSQKIQYFAQLFKVSPYYSFNLYLYGPYSPDLANDLFQIREKGDTVKLDRLIPIELEKRFQQLKKFIENKNNRELEIVATLHWLLEVAGFSNEKASLRLAEWKDASSEEIKYAFNELKNL